MQMQDDEEKKVKAIFLMCAYSSRQGNIENIRYGLIEPGYIQLLNSTRLGFANYRYGSHSAITV